MSNYEEWFLQSEYDLDTAQYMIDGNRYGYSVFMMHLSVEKAFKGLYQKKVNQVPPKIHNLSYFIEKLSLNVTEEIAKNCIKLTEANIKSRYPDSLSEMKVLYTKEISLELLKKSKEVIEWIKKML